MHIVEADGVTNLQNTLPIIDVRSEGEFAQGHIPGAINIPLLRNEERRLVGICYKEKGNEAAVLLGYELVGSQFATLIRSIKNLVPSKKVIIHCWRGGLRSRIVAQLLENAGFEVYILKGGYKTFRQWVLNELDRELPIKVIGGLTGSGKTELLHSLQQIGEQVIDLEGMVSHKGSAFGGIGQPPQPTQEQFENNLSYEIRRMDLSRNIWIEDESRKIGSLNLPLKLWEGIRNCLMYEIQIPYEKRLERIMHEYALLPKDKLAEKTSTLRKRLGDRHLNEILDYLNESNMMAWAAALLSYYDKNYLFGQNKREDALRKIILLNEEINAAEFLNSISL